MKETLKNEHIGRIQIADEVLCIVAGTAALEVEGAFTSQWGDARFSKKSFGKGVKVVVEKDKVSVDIAILVKYGHKIHVVSEEVQNRIKTALETMVGMNVKEVNVNVAGLLLEKVPRNKQRAQR